MKKRLRLKLPFRIILTILAIIVVVTLYFPTRSIFKLLRADYGLFSSFSIYNRGLYDDVIDEKYSKTVDKCVRNKDFDNDKIASYLKIDYFNRNNFLTNINKLIDLKYTIADINLINSKVNDDLYDILTKEYIHDISKYLSVDYFKEENFERYRDYFNGNYEKTVLYVNIGLDKEFYTDTTINDEFSNTMIVNKYHGVSKDFKAPDLVAIASDCTEEENYLNKEAAKAFEKMCRAAKKEGFDILANSTYRDYETQQSVWDTYYDLYGMSYNEKYVTKPGYSEHHTGLAVDIKSANSNIFEDSKEYKWTIENSYKYGFIHRYPKSEVSITGISSEAWHFRYVGVDVSTYIYENNLSFEEYYEMFINR